MGFKCITNKNIQNKQMYLLKKKKKTSLVYNIGIQIKDCVAHKNKCGIKTASLPALS